MWVVYAEVDCSREEGEGGGRERGDGLGSSYLTLVVGFSGTTITR